MNLQRVQMPEVRRLRRMRDFAVTIIAPDQELLREGYDIYPSCEVIMALKGLLAEDKACYWHKRVEDVARTYGLPFDTFEKQQENWFKAEDDVGSGIHDLVGKYRLSINGRVFAGSNPNFPLYDYRFHADATSTQEQHDLLNVHEVLQRVRIEENPRRAAEKYSRFPDAAADGSSARQGIASLVRA